MKSLLNYLKGEKLSVFIYNIIQKVFLELMYQ